MNNQDFFILAMYLFASLVVGFIIRKLVLPLLVKVTNLIRWKLDDIVINSIKNWIIFWFFLAGVALSLQAIHIQTNYWDVFVKIIIGSVIFSVTWIIASIVSKFMAFKTNAHGASELPVNSIVSNIIRITVYAVGFLILLQTLGISIAPLLTALGVGGLAVALALEQTLTNLFAGIQIIYSGKIRPNDYIQFCSGEEGFVENIAWRSTTVKALPDLVIIIPNSKMAEAIVRNYSLPENEINFPVKVRASFRNDFDRVERITTEVTTEALKNVKGGVPEFMPFICFDNLAESRIGFFVILRVKEYVNQYLVNHEFIKQLQKRYHQENIEVPFPVRNVYMKQNV
jgi:small-conductance mechanosensitive channel